MDYRINGFSFNRDNLAGLDVAERAGLGRYLATRERAINTISTRTAVCKGGPFDGQTIELEVGHDCSAPFTVGAWSGRYVVAGNACEGAPAAWQGAGEGPALANLQAGAIARTSAAVKPLGKGFAQLGALLASMSEEQAGEFAVFTIGRTSYRIRNTPAAIEDLRGKIIKAKRHFADKLLTVGAPAKHTADRMAEDAAILASTETAESLARLAQYATGQVAAVVATAQALANMAQAPALPAAELATVCAMDGAGEIGAAPMIGHAAGSSGPHDWHGAARGGHRIAHQAPAAPAGVQDLDQGPTEREGVQDLAPAPSIEAAAMLGDIPHGLARSAYQGTSYSPERRGDSARAEYGQTLAEDYAHFYAQAVKGGTLDQLQAEFDRYRAGMAGRYRAYLASSSRCVSSFIAGPSNFPARRMNKRADIAHKRLGEYLDGREAARRAAVRNLRPDLRPIMAGDADAADRLAVKIAQAERSQSTMKAANLAIRKNAKAGQAAQVAALVELRFTEDRAAELLRPDFAGRIGFADYSLTNNNANIRRMRERLAQIEQDQAAPVVETAGADGVRLEDDPPANRVRLYFPGKPAADVREELKGAGFRWAPSVGAWQGYRNYRTLTTARRLAGLAEAITAPAEAPAAGQHTPAEPAGVQDLDQAPAEREGVQDLDQVPPEPAGVQDLAKAPAPAKAKAKNIRLFVPELGQRLASKSGAWEAWFYQDKRGRPTLVFYRGKAHKPTKHFWLSNEARRLVALRNLAHDAEKAAESFKAKAQARAVERATPHGLQAGAVLVHTWGYEQTNQDFYQVVATVGRRMVEVRPIASDKHATGDMTGRCVPLPGQFTGAAWRALVQPTDQVRVPGSARGFAAPVEIIGKLPGGAPVYRSYSFSSYA